MEVSEIKSCRICGNNSLDAIINLGDQALSGRFPKHNEPDPQSAPLELVRCNDSANSNNCGLLQLKHTVPQEENYLHYYGYRSGINQTMVNHLTDVAQEAQLRLNLKQDDIVLDIGSNDATFLKQFPKKTRRLGIDPTGHQFESYYPKDIQLIKDFFTRDNFNKVYLGEKAKIISSISMFYDLPNPRQFVKDITKTLDKEGIWIMEQSYMPAMLEQTAFDTICHEHLEYYSLKPIKKLLNEEGLKIIDIDFNDTNGGSVRITSSHNESQFIKRNNVRIAQLAEYKKELDTIKPYEQFRKKVEVLKTELTSFLKKEKGAGKSIYICGASTKGNTLLQYFGIGREIITAASERNPDKFGRRTPLTNIPIIPESEVRKAKPDYLLVLPWHFRNEILGREKEYLNSGGKLIFPLPKFEVITK